MKDNSKKSRFKLFDLQRDGKGISKKDAELGSGLKKFFVSYKDNFGKIVSTNIFMILGNFPLIFLIATFASVTKRDAVIPLSDLFQNLFGLYEAEGALSPFKLSLFAIEGLQNHIVVPTAMTYVFYGISALTLITFGLVNVGTAFILRNLVSGQPVFVWDDFWYAVRRNWKQALPFGALDAFISALLAFNLYTTITADGFLLSVMFWCNVVISILYFFMRYYIYIQMVTFKLSVFKIIKNSMIFALLGFKRNIVAFFGIIAGIILEILFLFGSAGILVPFAVAAPLAILFSSFAYMKVYAAYYKIKEIMIDPYMEAHPELKKSAAEDEDVIMQDDVTENQRLEEIKRRNGIID